MGQLLPVLITIYTDKSFDFVIKTPPAPALLLEAAKVKKGSGEPNRAKAGSVSWDQVKQIAENQNGRFECIYRGVGNENGCRNCKKYGD